MSKSFSLTNRFPAVSPNDTPKDFRTQFSIDSTMRISFTFGRVPQLWRKDYPSTLCGVGLTRVGHISASLSRSPERVLVDGRDFTSSTTFPSLVPPTRRELLVVALRAGIPMIGFGFMVSAYGVGLGSFCGLKSPALTTSTTFDITRHVSSLSRTI